MNFRIRGLEARQFDHLFALSDAELAEHGAVRRIADGPRPCRISLSDAKPGDELILVNYEHHAVSSPYRMRFAIYIRRGEMDVQILCFPIRELARNCRFEVSTFDDLPARHHPRSVKAAHGECAFAKLFRHLSNGVEVSSPRRM